MTPPTGSVRRALRVAIALAISIAECGCSLTIDADRQQCVTDGDCRAHGTALELSVCKKSICVPDPTWACATDTDPTSDVGKGPFVVTLPVVDALSQLPMAGVTANVMRKIDVAGTTPLGAPAVSDASGRIQLTVEGGFDGYLTLTHPDIAPSLYFFNPPVTKSGEVTTIRLTTSATVAALFQSVGRTFDPTRGVVILTAEDCKASGLADVSFVVSGLDDVANFYSVDGLPTTTTTATDSSGYGGLLNVPAGTTAIRADHAKRGTIGQLSLFVRAGTLSYSRMVPRADE